MTGILQAVFQNQRSFATVPDAPTIGTAISTISTTATVAYTAPNYDGGSAITEYRVTSTPDSITATGSSSPITITGLTNGTSYTFTVAARNAVGYGAASAASNSVTPSPPAYWVSSAGASPSTVTVTDSSGNIYQHGTVREGEHANLLTFSKFNSSGARQSSSVCTGLPTSNGPQRMMAVVGSTTYSTSQGSSGWLTIIKMDGASLSMAKNVYGDSNPWGGRGINITPTPYINSAGDIYAPAYVTYTDQYKNVWQYTIMYKINSSGTGLWAAYIGGANQTWNGMGGVAEVGSYFYIYGRGYQGSGGWYGTVLRLNSTTPTTNESGSLVNWVQPIGLGFQVEVGMYAPVSGTHLLAGIVSNGTTAIVAQLPLALTGTNWIRTFIDTSSSGIRWTYITEDSNGNVYATGFVGKTGFLVKYNSSGTLQWQRKIVISSSNMSGFWTSAPSGLSVSGTKLLLGLSMYHDGGAFTFSSVQYPTDGSKTGVFTQYSYTGSSTYILTISAGNGTSSSPAATTGNFNRTMTSLSMSVSTLSTTTTNSTLTPTTTTL